MKTNLYISEYPDHCRKETSRIALFSITPFSGKIFFSIFIWLMCLPAVFAATVSTDKADYLPGDTVIITGSGWTPGETVSLTLTESPVIHTPLTLYAIADAGGSIYNNEFIVEEHDLGQFFTLDALGLTSGLTAQTTFTDGNFLSQAQNGGIGDPPIDPVDWINGNSNAQKSHYEEGQSIPYRLNLENVATGTHVLIIGWDIRDQGISAIDYITHYQRIDETVNPLQDLAGPFGSPNYFPIPAPASNTSATGFYGTQMQPLYSFNQLPADERRMTVWNATITSMTYFPEGDPTLAHSETRLRIEFTVTDGPKQVVFAWGGHISSRLDWGAGNASPNINGSPYHTRFIELDGQGGNQDRSLQANAVIFVPSCEVSGPQNVCGGSQNIFTATTNAPTPVYLWSVDNGASIIGSDTNATVTIQAPDSGSFTVTVAITDFSGGVESETTICSLPVNVVDQPDADAGSDQSKCADGDSTSFTLNGSIATGTGIWSLVDGTATIMNPADLNSIVYVHSASATLRLTSTNGNECDNATDDVILTVHPLPSCSIGSVSPSDLICNHGNYTISTSLDPALYDFEWSLSVDGDPSGWAITGSTTGQSVTFSSGDCGDLGFQVHFHLEVTDTNGCVSECDASFSPRAPLCAVDIRPPFELTCAETEQYLLAVYSTDILNPDFEWTHNGSPIGAGINDGSGADSILINQSGIYRFTITDPANSSNTCYAEVTVEQDTVQPDCVIGSVSPSDLICNHGNYSVSTSLDPSVYEFEWSMSVDGNPAGWAIIGSNTGQSITFSSGDCGDFGFQVHFHLTVTSKDNGCVSECDASFAPRAPLCVVDIRPPLELNCARTSQYLLAIYSTDIINPDFDWTLNNVSLGSGINDGSSADSILINEPGTYRFTITDPANASNTCFAEVIVEQDTTAPACSITGSDPDCLNLTNTYSGPAGDYSYSWSVTGDAVINGTDDEISVSVTATDSCASTYTLHLTVTDNANGCISECSEIYSFEDISAPVIGSPGPDAVIECPALPEFTAPVATDDCDDAPEIIEVSDITTPGNCPQEYVRTKSWIAVDNCGNESTIVSQSVTVTDNTAPEFSGVGNDMIIECPAEPSFSEPSATDACDADVFISYADTVTEGSCPQEYVIVRTWIAEDDCGNTTRATQAITVQDTTPPEISGAGADSIINCPEEPQFTAPTASDLCDPDPEIVLVSDITTPGNCEGEYVRVMTWIAQDACGNQSQEVSQTISVIDETAPVIEGEGEDALLASCDAIPEFTPPSATDSCDPAPEVISLGIDTLENNDGSVTYTESWYAIDDCGNISDTVEQSITVPACEGVFCSLTQGFYGNARGIACATGERGYVLIPRLLGEPYGDLIIGKPGRSLTIDQEHAECIIKSLPAGGTPSVLPSGDHEFDSDCSSAIPTKKNKFNNVLLGQTITLGLNLRLDAQLGSVQLEGVFMMTAASDPADDGLCGTDDDIQLEGVIVKQIPQEVLNALDAIYGDRSVASLFDLANRALGGMSTAGASLSQINQAVSAINEGFDHCRFLVGFTNEFSVASHASKQLDLTESDFTVNSYPNPFNEEITIEFTSEEDSHVTIEIFDLSGKKAASVFSGDVQGGNINTVKFNASGLPGGVYMYVVTSGDKSYQEKIILIK